MTTIFRLFNQVYPVAKMRAFIGSWLLCTIGFAQAKQPNILFVLTDDQDLHMESVEHMPYLKVRYL